MDDAQPSQPTTQREGFPTSKRLLDFTKHAYESATLKHARELHARILAELRGHWHGTIPGKTRDWSTWHPVNTLLEMVRTYLPHISGEELMPLVEPGPTGDRGDAKLLELRLQQATEDMGFARQYERVLVDALLTSGVLFIGRRDGGQVLSDQESTVDLGAPFVKSIPPKRRVYDPNADALNESEVMGHWSKISREALLESGIGDPDIIRNLPNVWDQSMREQGVLADDEARQELHLADEVLVWEVCFRHAGRLFCCILPPIDGSSGFVVEPYELGETQPDGMPYLTLAFNQIGEHTLPVSPAMAMMDAHLAMKMISAKAVKEIEDLERRYMAKRKERVAVNKLMEPDGKGRVVFTDDPDAVKEFIRGGLTKEAIEAYMFLERLGSRIGPTVQFAAGQNPDAGSATEASIQAGNAGVVMGYWTRQAAGLGADALKRIAALQLISGDVRELAMEVGGGGVPVVWDASTLDLSWQSFKYRMRSTNPMAGMDPRQKLRSLFEIIQTLPGYLQFLLSIGADAGKGLQVVSDMSGMRELAEILPSPHSEALKQRAQQMLLEVTALRQGGQSGGQQVAAGPSVDGGPMQQRVNQMQSDYAGGVPA